MTTAPAHRHRASALILTLIVVAMATALALTFLSAQSTSIGLADNIRNRGRSRHVAETGLSFAIAYVKANSAWRTQFTSGSWVSNESFGGGTFTIAGVDGLDTDGDGMVEGDGSLTDDLTDPLTLTVTGTVSGASHMARAVMTPNAPEGAMLVYGVAGENVPRSRLLVSGAWSSEQRGNDIGGEPRWVVAAQCPTRDERAICIVDSAQDLNIQFYASGAWSSVTELTTATVQISERPFDVAYEQNSGDLLIAYRASATDNLYYRTYNGTTISTEANYALSVTDDLRFVRLVPKPGSDEIMLLTINTGMDICAAVWNGSAWTSPILLETTTKSAGDEGMHATYESLSGHALVAWADDGVNTFRYRTWDGTFWSYEATGPALGSKDPRWIRMTPNPLSDQILLGSLDGKEDLYTVTWGGSSWGTSLLLEDSTPDANSREFDIAYANGGVQALVVWGQSTDSYFYYRVWDGSAWGSEQAGPDLSDNLKFVQLVRGPEAGQIFAHVLTKSYGGELGSFLWDGTWTKLGTMATDLAGANTQETFMAAVSASGAGATTYDVAWRP